ncbi:MAG: dihydrolipoyl dehydrogenase, partial [Methylobacteriaceae bacterium]|nr:dihydrolipoyl dehydrogenase [Methylobacteriaceae bacterium]
MPTYDILIIGSGPGGYVTAIRSAQLGFKTGIIEREHLGGICLNWGCIPTKALLRSAEIFGYARHMKDYGLTLEGTIGHDMGAIVKRSRNVSGQLNQGVGFLMRKNKVDVIWGEAQIAKPGEVVVKASTKSVQGPPIAAPKGALGPGTYGAKHIIIATGARPRALPGIEPDKKLVWTYFEAMVLDRLPKSLLVIGSGAIGIEFASFFRTLGSEVTVVEILPQILPAEDAEIAAHARKRFEKAGIKILTGAKVASIEKGADSVVATIDDGKGGTQKITVERVISAVGVTGNIENLGLEKLGVKTERGTIVTDGVGRTNVAGLCAIGDVAGPPMLAHKAEHEGVVCVEAIKGLAAHPIDKRKSPGCTYCQPQIASVGLTEAKAKEAGM